MTVFKAHLHTGPKRTALVTSYEINTTFLNYSQSLQRLVNYENTNDSHNMLPYELFHCFMTITDLQWQL